MRICVLGSAPSSVALAPYKDKSYAEWAKGGLKAYPMAPFINEHWKIWGCSPGAFGIAPRADAWFEVHRWEPGQTWFSPEYCQWLREFDGPVYTGRPIPEIKNHVVYPLAEIEEMFSAYFLTSSLSLMLALAIKTIEDARKGGDTGDHTIGMWGVDMAANEEWHYQRPGCQFFILEALRRGIEVYIPPESDILRPQPVYGISEWDPSYIKATARMRELNTRREAHMKAAQEASNNLQFVAGAVDNMDYMVKTWLCPYGLPAGTFIKLQPGTGLGGGMTMVDDHVPAPRHLTTFWDPKAPPHKGNGLDATQLHHIDGEYTETVQRRE